MSNNPFEQQPVPHPSTDPTKRPDWMAITSLICGICSLVAWCIPLCGCPVSIGGIVFGALGMKSDKRTMAIIGMILSILGMAGTLINGAIGAYLGATGQHPLFPHR